MERRIVVEGREILYELTAKKVKNLNLRVRPDGRVGGIPSPAVCPPRRRIGSSSPAARGCCGRWTARRRGGMRFPKPPFPDCGANRWTSSAGRVPPRGRRWRRGACCSLWRIRRRNPPCSAAGSRSRRRPNSPPGWRPFIPWPRPRGWRVPSSGCGG